MHDRGSRSGRQRLNWAGVAEPYAFHVAVPRVALGERPQLGRLKEMTESAEERLVEAKVKSWLGEVAAVEESLQYLRTRRDEAQRRRTHGANPFADTRHD